MPSYNHIQNGFQFGELSPRFLGRTDTEQYQKGAAKIENMIVLPTGGVTRRPGTVYVDSDIIDASDANGFIGGRLFPFKFSITETYAVAILLKNNGSGIGLDCKIYSPSGRITGVDDTSVTIDPSYFADTTWTQDDLDQVHFCQSGDLLFFAHKNHPPFLIRRNSEKTFEFLTVMSNNWSVSGSSVTARPWRDTNISAITITPSATTGIINLVASDDLFDSRMAPSNGEQTYFYITDTGGTTGVVTIVSVGSPTAAVASVLVTLGGTGATDEWGEAAWGPYRGYPATVGIFESRLIWGGCDAQPDTFWGSMVGNFAWMMAPRLSISGLNYTGDALETDPIVFTPSASEVNRIHWLQGGRTLAIGTMGQEFVSVGTESRILSASAVSLQDHTTVGSAYVQAARVNKVSIFVSRDGKRVFQHGYDTDSGSYIAEELTLLADHIVEQTDIDELEGDDDQDANELEFNGIGILNMCWQQSRRCLWAVTSNYRLIGCTIAADTKTLAWHRHILGGSWIDEDDNEFSPKVLSATVVSSADGRFDNLWLLVRRTIDDEDRMFVEVMGPDYKHRKLNYPAFDFDEGEYPVYVDCAKEFYVEDEDTVHSGFGHLEGEEVQVLADGFYHPPVTVAGGEIELERDAAFVIAGLQYTPKLKLPPIEAGAALGSGQGSFTRVDQMTIRFYNSLRAKVVGPGGTEEAIQFRPGSLGMGAQIPLFTGDKRVNVPMGAERRAELEITQDQPFPLTILAVVLRGQTSG